MTHFSFVFVKHLYQLNSSSGSETSPYAIVATTEDVLAYAFKYGKLQQHKTNLNASKSTFLQVANMCMEFKTTAAIIIYYDFLAAKLMMRNRVEMYHRRNCNKIGVNPHCMDSVTELIKVYIMCVRAFCNAKSPRKYVI